MATRKGIGDILNDAIGTILVPRKGTGVAPASKVARSTRNREAQAYRGTFPADARPTMSQAKRATAAMRRRGTVPQVRRAESVSPEQREASERFRQRSERSRGVRPPIGGGGIGSAKDYDPAEVMQKIKEKIGETFLAEAQRDYDKLVENDTTGQLTPGKVTGMYFEFNDQAVTFNMQQASRDDRVWAVETAKGWDIRKRAYDANRRGIDSVWFYHGDMVQNGF